MKFIEIQTFSFKKIHLKNVVWKMAAILSRPQCVNSQFQHECVHGWERADGSGCDCETGWMSDYMDHRSYNPTTHILKFCNVINPHFHYMGRKHMLLMVVSFWWKKYQVLLCQSFLINTLRPRQNVRHFAEEISECIFLNENIWISIEISLNLSLRIELTIFQTWFI